MMLIVKHFNEYHDLFNILILITSLFSHDWDSSMYTEYKDSSS